MLLCMKLINNIIDDALESQHKELRFRNVLTLQ